MRFIVEWLIFIPLLIIINIFTFDIHKLLDIKVSVILISSLVFIFGFGSSFFVVFAGREKNLKKENENEKDKK